MTDKEIIKALECCCEAELKVDCQKLKCPFFDNEIYNCMNVDDENAMYRYSLDLINRQQAEIERLTARNFELAEKGEKVVIAFKNAKAEAIKEFAERLKKRGFADKHYEHESIVYVADIDNLVKEMVGE